MSGPVRLFSESPEDPFSVSRAASAVLDQRGTVVGWGKRAEKLLGHRADEIIGRPAADVLVAPADRADVGEAVAACVGAPGWFGVVPVVCRDGTRLRLGVRARRVARSGGDCEWFLVGALAEDVVQWETDRSVLDGLFRRSPIGLAVMAPDLGVLRVNRAIAGIAGLPAEQIRGHRTGDFLVSQDAETVERRLRHVLETGRPMIFTEQPCRLRADPSQQRYVSVSAFRMEDSEGKTLGVTQLVEDVTERHRAQLRLALLNEAGARIGTTLDVPETARELAAVLVPELADCATVDLLEPVSRGEEPSPDGAGELRRAAAECVVEGADEVLYPVGGLITFPKETPQGRCLAEQRPILIPHVQGPTGLAAVAQERADRASELGVHSVMMVPLAARGLVLGFVTLWRARCPDAFVSDDLTLAGEFAARAAVCIDNARRYTREHEAALTLQCRLLPGEVPDLPAVEVSHQYTPAGAVEGVGGDWFDVIPLSGARVALVVGDVIGHGIDAAATMGRLRTAVHTLADLDLEPEEVLSHLDDLVHRLAEEQEASSRAFSNDQVTGASCLYAVYDPVSRCCTMARAGHPLPAVVTPGGGVSFPELPAGPPLGLGGLPFESMDLELPEGSLLVLYTNGLIQTRGNDIDVALARLSAELSARERPLPELSKAVVKALLPARPTDDVALLLARTRTLGEERVATWTLPAEASAASRARALMAEQLSAWQLDEMVFTTELIVSELVTNAYRYGGGPVTLRLIRGPRLICEVSDASSTAPHLRRARSTDEGGRGLFLVAQLTERWGTRYGRDGKTVWTEQAIRTGPGAAADLLQADVWGLSDM
ncbi:protein phosphatase [Streptomyces cinnamoneus]|uniref:Protein phosphatase n=1 Tax=Streptomyces cinnamoneus TaxID=53446 RepID=A0A2G1XNI2_STRCJ|nr:SpoIIE family protein phosphatase [Streptomyces cinnamoneus]PHQ52780.1 protein phosphatase [Streptomyces cinnamoneus]PPT11882.1 PAS domain S-box protein [Streptomyces cinnamoneus]